MVLAKAFKISADKRCVVTVGVSPTGVKTLSELLDYLRAVGNMGHTFDIVVDRDERGHGGKVFEWDGDGSDFIDRIDVVKPVGLEKGIPRDRQATVTVTATSSGGGTLQKLLEHLKVHGNPGHSFSIVVDPGASEFERKFFWDGDGSDAIVEVKAEFPEKPTSFGPVKRTPAGAQKSGRNLIKAYTIPPVFRLNRIAGQVPSKGRMRTLGQIQALSKKGARSGEGAANLTLGKLAGKPQRLTIPGDPFPMPDDMSEERLLAQDQPVLSPSNVVAGLGLDADATAEWVKFLDKAQMGTDNETVFRQTVMVKLQESGFESPVRNAVLSRALTLWRSVQKDDQSRKSECLVIDLEKAKYTKRWKGKDGKWRYEYAKEEKHGYDITTGEGQKRLMYEAVGIDITQKLARPVYYKEGEHGSDPILDAKGEPTGKVRMVPTGRVVDVKTGKEVEQPVQKDAMPITQGMKLKAGQRIQGTYGGKPFTGVVAQLRQVEDTPRRAPTRGEALVQVDNPESLAGAFGDPDPEGREQLFLTTSTQGELEDSRVGKSERSRKSMHYIFDLAKAVQADLFGAPEHFMIDGKALQKALFIGPRGGKWANAKHTIPYDAKKHGQPKKRIHVVDKTKGEGGLAKEAAPESKAPSPVDPGLWEIGPKFGPAGGPEEIRLTAAGQERVGKVVTGLDPKALAALEDMPEDGSPVLVEEEDGTRVKATRFGREHDRMAIGTLTGRGLAELAIIPDRREGAYKLTEKGKQAFRDINKGREQLLARVKATEAAKLVIPESKPKALKPGSKEWKERYVLPYRRARARVKETIAVGKEYGNELGEQFGVVLKEISGKLPYRIQWYNSRDGIWGHEEVASLDEAAERLIEDLGTETRLAPGTFDKMALLTPKRQKFTIPESKPMPGFDVEGKRIPKAERVKKLQEIQAKLDAVIAPAEARMAAAEDVSLHPSVLDWATEDEMRQMQDLQGQAIGLEDSPEEARVQAGKSRAARRAAKLTIKREPVPIPEKPAARSELAVVGDLLSGKLPLQLIKNPAGTWSLVGSVPMELAWVRKDGKPLTEKNIAEIKHTGSARECKMRSWSNPAAAKVAVAKLGGEVDVVGDEPGEKSEAGQQDLFRGVAEILTPDELLQKGEPRGGSYFKRTPAKKAGKWRYFYKPDDYNKRDDAHVGGEDAGNAYLTKKILGCVGEKGCGPESFKDLVKKHGHKKVAQVLRVGQKGGTLAFKKGKFSLCKRKG